MMTAPDVSRRFQVHYGQGADGVGYVVTDSQQDDSCAGPLRWRGKVVFRTDSRSDAEAKAEELNER